MVAKSILSTDCSIVSAKSDGYPSTLMSGHTYCKTFMDRLSYHTKMFISNVVALETLLIYFASRQVTGTS